MNKVKLLNRLQLLNIELEAMRDEFNSSDDKYVKKMIRDSISHHLARIAEVEFLLSDKHTEAITEEAHFANTMLGEVCSCCKRPTSETYRASSSETAVVGQNLDKLKPEE